MKQAKLTGSPRIEHLTLGTWSFGNISLPIWGSYLLMLYLEDQALRSPAQTVLMACSWANGFLSHLHLGSHLKVQNTTQKGQPFTQCLETAQSISIGWALVPTIAEHIFHTLACPFCLPTANPLTLQNSHSHWLILLWTCVVLSSLHQNLVSDFEFYPTALWLFHVFSNLICTNRCLEENKTYLFHSSVVPGSAMYQNTVLLLPATYLLD